MNSLICRLPGRRLLARVLLSLSGLAGPVFADSTPQTLPFAQNWSWVRGTPLLPLTPDSDLIWTNDFWTDVPGIVGYRGDNLTAGIGTNPQTILGEGTPVFDVIANQSNPNTLFDGGVAEFDGVANPTIALQGSGTADAPGIVITVDTTGFTDVTVAYNLRDIDGSADDTSQQVALQYRVGTTGNFTDVPAGYVTDATTGPSLATLVTPVLATLPAAANNQPVVQIRILTTNAAGSDEWVGIDDISIIGTSDGGATAPSIETQPSPQMITEGGSAVFSALANGTPPLAYRWRRGAADLFDGVEPSGLLIAGADSATLNLSQVPLSEDGALFSVVVTNAVGSTPSNGALLTVNPLLVAPTITLQPSPQSVTPDGTATFTVAASGTAPLSYQWSRGPLPGVPLVDGPGVSGAQTETLTLNDVGAGEVGDYRVVVSNGVNPPATSNAAALTLNALINPFGQISYAGGSYTQDFNTLPSSGTFTLPDNGPHALSNGSINASGTGGWTFAKYDGTGSAALFRVDTGTSNSGAVYSYGTSAASDRALGALASGTTISQFGVMFVNDTGQTINEFTLSYTGEEWRRGGSGVPNTLAVDYAVGAAAINAGAFTPAPGLNFNSPNVVGGGGALDGNAGGNRMVVSGTVAGVAWAPGQTLVLRWTDVNDAGSDDGLAVDDLSFSTPVGPEDLIPAVSFVIPTNGTVNVLPTEPILITFNEAVNVTGTWFDLTGSSSGPRTATVSAASTSYFLTPNVPFAEGELVTLTVFAAQVTDGDTGTQHPAADFTSQFFTFSSAPLPIHTVQGSGTASMFAGYPVTVQGVVVASFQGAGGIGGYYIEAPDAQHDADAATSEGIYVFDNANAVAVGDLVTVTGTVAEFGLAPDSGTEIKTVTAFTRHSTGNPLPAPAIVSLPFANAGYPERYEGMLVQLPQSLTVTDNFDLGHFGEIDLSNGRLPQPTNIAAPGAPAQAQEAANRLNRIVLDDGLATTYPDPTPFLAGGTGRAGSTTSGVTGILDQRFGTYVIEATQPVTFVASPRPAGPPAVGGSMRVAMSNVLNYFNGDGLGGGFPTSRGASSSAEFQRQKAKTVAGILGLMADVVGLTEVENDRITNGAPDSYGPTSAIADLVNALNAAAPAGFTYAYINAAAVDIVTDEIHSAFIYRTETVTPVGLPAMLSSPYFNNHARNPLAQTFREKATGGVLTVCINHFRAKAGPSSVTDGIVPNPNVDNGDGQGNNNYLRTKEAQALAAWLATDPTGSGDPDHLIIGDLNAYAREDPLTALANAGYLNLTEQFEGVGGYSYAFDGAFGHLDHALGNGSLATQVTGAATWHVNADEPVYYDYNLENKSAAQQAINASGPYRNSDHDPVVVGFSLRAPPTVTTQPVPQTVPAGTAVTLSVEAIGGPTPTYQWRYNGQPIAGATGANYTIDDPQVSDSGSYDVLISNGSGTVPSAAVTVTVLPATAAITLTDLVQSYDGTPKEAVAETTPAGLDVTVTYDGSATPPTSPGVYAVVATIVDPVYQGSAAGTLVVTTTALVRHLPSLAGGIDGSLQVLSAENVALNSAWISGDLLVPGTPGVRLNGHPTFVGTRDAGGDAAPTNYQVTLNGNSVLRYLVRQVDPVALPVVSPPPAPTGTRDVTINKAGSWAGDFATVRNLTLNGNAGAVAVPPGTYANFSASGNSQFVLGVAGAATPAAYNLQNLSLGANCTLRIVGPVILTVANGVTVSGTAGAAAQPDWLTLNVAAGGLTLNGSAWFHGYVVAPAGAVTLNGNSTLNGGVASDRLTITGNSFLNQP